MAAIETLRPSVRGLFILSLGLLLVGSFVFAGIANEPNPAHNDFPDNDDVGPQPEAYLGEQVSVTGTAVSQDPLRIRIDYGVDETIALPVTNVENPPPVGDTLWVFGTLTDPTTIRAQSTVTREPWEATYMYVVSFIGGLWVLGRLCRHWRYDHESKAFVPR